VWTLWLCNLGGLRLSVEILSISVGFVRITMTFRSP
jgi:hypothetical protein